MLKKLVSLSLATLVLLMMPVQLSAEEMTASEILRNSNEAMAELESYSIKTKMEQAMPMLGETMTIFTQADVDITLNPFAMHQVITTSTHDKGELSLESYWTEEGFYQEDPTEGWMRMPDAFSEGIDKLKNITMAEGQIAQSEELGKNMSVEDQGSAYLLTYEGDEKVLMELIQKVLGPPNMSGEEGMMDQMTLNDINYEVIIDKETYYMTKLMINLNAGLGLEGQTMDTTQSIEMSIYNFNNVDNIVVPAGVVNTAVPLNEHMDKAELKEEGGELADTATNYPVLALAGAAMAFAGGGLLLYRRRTMSNC